MVMAHTPRAHVGEGEGRGGGGQKHKGEHSVLLHAGKPGAWKPAAAAGLQPASCLDCPSAAAALDGAAHGQHEAQRRAAGSAALASSRLFARGQHAQQVSVRSAFKGGRQGVGNGAGSASG